MNYPALLKEIKDRIRHGQIRSSIGMNAEMLAMYWDIGRIINERQGAEGWGTGVIPRLAVDIRNDLTEVKGFSERNIYRMLAFYREYPRLSILPQPLAKLAGEGTFSILPQAVAKLAGDGKAMILPQPVAKLPDAALTEMLQKVVPLMPWGHTFLLIEKIKNLRERVWYMQQALAEGWGRDTLAARIKSNAFQRLGKAITNFATHLPAPQTALAQESLKDPYLFDFLTLTEPFRERKLETGLVGHVEKFLLELGAGFAFVGLTRVF
jgi:predicted nuclease of restriction endonuclease-like (RecB) superfamily